MAPEIRFTITEKLDKVIQKITEELGIDKSDYVRSLILSDLREKGVNNTK
jgi:isopentenyldiphosphate isomerase